MVESDDVSGQHDLEFRLGFESLLADISARFVSLPAHRVDEAIRDAQRRVCDLFGVDLCMLWQWVDADRRFMALSHYYGEMPAPPPEPVRADEFYPYYQHEILAGRVVKITSLDEMPPEAARDAETSRQFGVKSTLAFPLSVGDELPIGALAFNTLKAESEWPEKTTNRLRLVAQIFANALARKWAEHNLRESQERLDLAAGAAGAGFWNLDAASGRFWISDQTRAIFGFSPETELTLESFLAVVHPEDRELVQQTIAESLRESQEHTVEYRIIHRDGSVRWISSRGRAWRDTAENPGRMSGLSMDITEHKRSELLLREHRDRFAAAVELAGLGFYDMQMDPLTVFLDTRAQAILGIRPGERCQVWDYFLGNVHPDDRKKLQQLRDEYLTGDINQVKEVYRYIHPVEGERWLSHFACVFERDAQGHVRRDLGILQDITASRRAELAQAESEALKTAILSSLASHVAVIDRDGRIIAVNEAWRRFGTDNGASEADSTPGSNYLAAVERAAGSGSQDAAVALAGIRQVIDEAWERFEHEYECHSPDQKRWFLMIVTPFRGSCGGAVIAHIDVTEQKKSRLELEQAFAEIQQLKERLQQENILLHREVSLDHASDEIIGQSAAIRRVLRLAEQVAPTDSSVLILGETGTGKELIARFIHQRSRRHGRLMAKVNCSALPATLIESELFGREKGAYTGAMTRQAGRFEVADGSTLFLDEIGELPLDLQAKLLQVLQDGRFERLGSAKTVSVDVRFIVATNRDLAEEVRKGRFRQDLYYRLNVFPIQVPPLRERADDIPLMVQAFVGEFAGRIGRKIRQVPRRAMDTMLRYPWPGNIRELRNVIERAVIICPGDTLQLEIPDLAPGDLGAPSTLAETEAEYIRAMLRRTGGRVKGAGGAAALLGMKPSTLYSRMKKLGIPTRTSDG
jgi:PAS domain S-box-containing protein